MTAPLRIDHAIFAGDLFELAGVVDGGLTGTQLFCTVKKYRSHADAAAIARATTATVDVVIESDTAFTVRFDATVTRDWPAADLWYDVQSVNGDEVYSVARGIVAVRRRITRAHLDLGPRPPLIADAAALTLAAADATLSVAHRVEAEAGALVLTGADAALTYTPVTLATLLSQLGARLHFLYEVGVSAETLVSGRFSQLNDMGPSGYHVTQGIAVQRPAKQTVGGPSGKPWMEFQSSDQRLLNSAIALTAGRALSFFAVAKLPTGGLGGSVAACARDKDTESVDVSSDVVCTIRAGEDGSYVPGAKVQAGAEESTTVTSPINDTGWHSWWQQYAAGVAPVVEIDGAAVTLAPAFSGTGLCTLVELVSLGHDTLARGGLYLFGAVEDCTAAEKGMIRSYLRNQSGV